MAKILIIDDESELCEILSRKLRAMSHEVDCAYNLQDGIRKAVDAGYDIVYLDVRLPDGNGLDAIDRIRNSRLAPEVIIMTGRGEPDGAELAIRNGAWDYIQKPSSISTMILPAVRALQYRECAHAARPAAVLKREGIIGSSVKMQLCLNQIAQASGSNTNVLIHGETGTGKELAAWAIHNNSGRAGRNFVVVDCASLSETLVESMLFGHTKGAYTGADAAQDGLIRQADGGTLFLDEIGELSASIQKSFLRVLQERRFRPLGSSHEIVSDFRLIAATNRNMDRMAEEGQFRSDLLYRVRSFQIDIPPLRERASDITELAVYHVRKICERYHMAIKEISPELSGVLNAYSWPGNVRELVNILERVVAVARDESILIPKHLPQNIRIQVARSMLTNDAAPDAVRKRSDAGEEGCPSWEDFRRDVLAREERRYLENLLTIAGRNPRSAMTLSGLSRSRLYELLQKYHLTFPA